jgi:hypothetical protein
MGRGKEISLWTGRINPQWKNMFEPTEAPRTLAYEFISSTGISLAVVPERGIFRYDGGATHMSSAEFTDPENASHLMRLDAGEVPDKLGAISFGIEMFQLLQESFSPQAILRAIEKYWVLVQDADAPEKIDKIMQETRDLAVSNPEIILFAPDPS